MLPTEIGHAAAYEAYRTWIHNSSMYEPLSGDIHKQREGLIGLAVAEGSTGISFLLSILNVRPQLLVSSPMPAVKWIAIPPWVPPRQQLRPRPLSFIRYVSLLPQS